MRFQEVLGNTDVKESLVAMADAGRLPHTMMLTGPKGIGKFRMARAFAQYVHCESPEGGDSCGRCSACRQHASLNFPDMHYVFPVVKKQPRMISADYMGEWRELIENTPYPSLPLWGEAIDAGNTAPTIYVREADEMIRIASLSNYSAEKKIFLIWLPEKMQPATANKLLKLLEEPFENTLFIMVSEEPGAVLPTIISRTQRIEMKRLSDEEIVEWLEATEHVDEKGAAEIAHLAQGSPARALEILGSDEETASHRALFQLMMRMAYACNGAELKKIADEIAGMGRQKSIRYLSYSLAQIRENFITNFHLPELVLQSAEETAFSSRFAPFIHEGNINGLAEEFTRASNDIARNANAKIVCFDLMLKLMVLLRAPRQS